MLKDRYENITLIKKGRTGGVYQAEDSKLKRDVAIRRFFDKHDVGDVVHSKQKFAEVAQALTNLQHPNLIRVFDVGVDDEGAYVVSQLLKGKPLHEGVAEGAMSAAVVVDVASQLLDAFSMAHDSGYYHGALTSGSIMMIPQARGGYRYVVLDMGLSSLAPLVRGRDAVLAVMADQAILAPELFEGAAADEKSDLYMLGQIFYMCLAGGHPYGGLGVQEVKDRHAEGLPPISQYNPNVPQELDEWLLKLIAVNRDDRPASAVEALDALPQVTPALKPRLEPELDVVNQGASAMALPLINITGEPSNNASMAPGVSLESGPVSTTVVPTTYAVPEVNAQVEEAFPQVEQKKSSVMLITLLSLLLVIAAAGAFFVFYKMESSATEAEAVPSFSEQTRDKDPLPSE